MGAAGTKTLPGYVDGQLSEVVSKGFSLEEIFVK